MKAIALLGGPSYLWPNNFLQVQNKKVIGVDRGTLFLLEKNIVPDIAIGDFDSLKKSELQLVEKKVKDIHYSSPIKDLTDAELMLKVAFDDYQIEYLDIYGATGGRLDHFLANLFAVLKPEFNQYAEKISLLDIQNRIDFYNAGTHIVPNIEGYKYVGVIPLNKVDNLTISHARYDLNNFSTMYPISFASNEFLPNTKDLKISFTTGTVAIIYSKDINRFANI